MALIESIQRSDEKKFEDFFPKEEFDCSKLDPQDSQKKAESEKSPDYKIMHKGTGKSFETEIKSIFSLNLKSSAGTIVMLSSMIKQLPYGYDIIIESPVFNWSAKRVNKFIVFLNIYLPRLAQREIRHSEYTYKSLKLKFRKNREGSAELKLPKVTEPLETREKLRQTIKSARTKSTKQSHQALPFVISLHNHDPLVEEDEFFQACLGDYTLTLRHPDLEVIKEEYGRNSIFRPDMNTRISAIVFFNDFIVNGIDQRKYIVLHNPFAQCPLESLFFKREGAEQWVIDKYTCCPKLIE